METRPSPSSFNLKDHQQELNCSAGRRVAPEREADGELSKSSSLKHDPGRHQAGGGGGGIHSGETFAAISNAALTWAISCIWPFSTDQHYRPHSETLYGGFYTQACLSCLHSPQELFTHNNRCLLLCECSTWKAAWRGRTCQPTFSRTTGPLTETATGVCPTSGFTSYKSMKHYYWHYVWFTFQDFLTKIEAEKSAAEISAAQKEDGKEASFNRFKSWVFAYLHNARKKHLLPLIFCEVQPQWGKNEKRLNQVVRQFLKHTLNFNDPLEILTLASS